MDEIADRRAEGFSRGQRQKIVLGRALVHGPHNIIMDEPLAIGSALPAFALVASIAGSLLASAAGFVVALRLFNRERLLYSA